MFFAKFAARPSYCITTKRQTVAALIKPDETIHSSATSPLENAMSCLITLKDTYLDASAESLLMVLLCEKHIR